MRALFFISIGGQDVSRNFKSDATDISITDSAGGGSDTASIDIDDRDGLILMPSIGDEISIGLGWEGGGVPVVFDGVIDDVDSSGGRGQGRKLLISAKSADVNGKLKSTEEKHKDDASLKDVANEWGKAAGLSEVVVHPDLSSIKRAWWGMDGESFMSWGRRIAGEIGATFKVMGTRGVFTPRSAGQSATGQPLPVVTATYGGNLIGWSLKPDVGRPKHKTFKTRRFDHDAAEWKSEDASPDYDDDGEATRVETYSAPDEDTAKANSESAAKESDRERGGGSIDIDGNPDAMAEGMVILIGARPGVDGTYTIDSVTHSYSRSGGFTTSMTVKKPDAKKDGRPSS